jgi:hypothetical protein
VRPIDLTVVALGRSLPSSRFPLARENVEKLRAGDHDIR